MEIYLKVQIIMQFVIHAALFVLWLLIKLGIIP